MGREISHEHRSEMDWAERDVIRSLQEMPSDIVRVKLPDGVMWRKAVLTKEGVDTEEKERLLLEDITDADESVKRSKRGIRLYLTGILSTLGIIFFFAGVDLPGVMRPVGLTLSIIMLVAELILGGVLFFSYIIPDKGDGPWKAKRKADRAYRDWLTKGK